MEKEKKEIVQMYSIPVHHENIKPFFACNEKIIIFVKHFHPMTNSTHTPSSNWWRRWLMHIVA